MNHTMHPYPEYRDSGVPWLGEIPAHWHVVRLDRLFNLRSETPIDGDERVTGYLDGRVTLRSNVVGQKIKGVIKEAGWQRIHPGDFAISGMNAHLGGMGVSDSLGKCSPIYLVLKPKQNTNAHFVSHAVRYAAHSGVLKALVSTIRFNSADFKRDDLKLMSVWVPPSDEQAAIVRFLEHTNRRVNRFVRAKRRLVALLNEQKQAIIHRAVTRGLDPDVRLKPSGVAWLPEIPRHWLSVRLGTLAKSLQTGPFGSQLHAQDYVPNGIPVINPSHMKDGIIYPDFNCAVSSDKFTELSRHKLLFNDIVFARRGELGRCALVGEQEIGWLCGTGSLRVRLKEEGGVPTYLLQLFLSKGVAEWLSLQSVGSTMENLNTGILASMPIPLPPKEEQQDIVNFLKEQQSIFEVATDRVEREIALIREYRTRLVADVVTGKLDVRGVALHDDMPIEDGMPLDVDELIDDADLEQTGENTDADD